MRILIADDDEEGFVPICASLEADGHAVTQTFDGEAALELLSQEPFDVAVFDLDMPKRDGVSLVRELRARSLNLPIVLVSGNGNVHKVGRELGIEHCLLKPFGIDDLTAALVAAVAGTASTDSHEDRGSVPPSSGFPTSEAATQIRLRYRVLPADRAENDG